MSRGEIAPCIRYWGGGEQALGRRVDVVVDRDRRAHLHRGTQRDLQLRRNVDLDDVVELLCGALYYRFFLRNRPITADQAADIVETAFTGLRPTRPPRTRPRAKR